MTKLAFVYNDKNERCRELMQRVADYAVSRGAELMMNGDCCGFSIENLSDGDFPEAECAVCDAAVVFGGDGTMLAATRRFSLCETPLFCVDLGRVGFLSSVKPEEIFPAIDRPLAGDYTVRDRMMISCGIRRNDQLLLTCNAFNDFTVRSSLYSRAVFLSLLIDHHPVYHFHGDGLIVATPTGSTGYSLSAGGPIVMDDIKSMLITPVCAQSLVARPIVVAADSEIEIVCHGNADSSALTADGQFRIALADQDRVLIGAAAHQAHIIYFDGVDFFARIREKLFHMD